MVVACGPVSGIVPRIGPPTFLAACVRASGEALPLLCHRLLTLLLHKRVHVSLLQRAWLTNPVENIPQVDRIVRQGFQEIIQCSLDGAQENS